jgi:AAA+ ATPase superfamily predicted ATPase
MKLIGRVREQGILKELLNSDKAEFLAVYGRRRIGKTFLIREYFKSKNVLFFNSSGIKDGSLSDQIKHFTQEISVVFYNGINLTIPESWDKAFEILTKALASLPPKKKIILFFDELPWMATKNSKLLQMIDYYWNQHWSRDARIKLIICGSSATWIIDKIIRNRGGLHNRITGQIHLMPFNLKEVKEFLHSKSIKLTDSQICQIYMAMGGVPHYLNFIKKGLSAAQNIDALAFALDGLLAQEFDNLFASLFDRYELCIKLITLIARSSSGISQEEIFKEIGSGIDGYTGLQRLKELESAGFIIRYKPYLHAKRGIYYKVIDEYTLFYLKWIKPIKDSLVYDTSASGYFEAQQNSPNWYNWAGYAFEAICYKHISQIRQALALDVSAMPYSWRFSTKDASRNGAQIDLLFDRHDDSITICEIKFTNKGFCIDKSYAAELENKVQVFKSVTRTKKQIFLAMISASGVRKSKYSDKLVSKVVELEDLFY